MKKLYCIPNKDEIKEYLDFANTYNAGFEYNDFFLPSLLDDNSWVEERIHLYQSLDRDTSEDTLHGVFLDICINSDDPQILKVSDKRIHQSMDIGQKLGVKAVVFHTNMISNFRLASYQKSWIDRNESYWKRLLQEYNDMEIYIENMFDENSELILELAKRMKGQERFGICFDLAHGFISGESLSTWMAEIGPYVKHLHINDNMGEEDTHFPVGAGKLPWEDYQQFIQKIPEDKRPSVLIEVRGIQDLKESVHYMEQQGLYPLTKEAAH